MVSRSAGGCFGVLGVVVSLTLKFDRMRVARWNPRKPKMTKVIPKPDSADGEGIRQFEDLVKVRAWQQTFEHSQTASFISTYGMPNYFQIISCKSWFWTIHSVNINGQRTETFSNGPMTHYDFSTAPSLLLLASKMQNFSIQFLNVVFVEKVKLLINSRGAITLNSFGFPTTASTKVFGRTVSKQPKIWHLRRPMCSTTSWTVISKSGLPSSFTLLRNCWFHWLNLIWQRWATIVRVESM